MKKDIIEIYIEYFQKKTFTFDDKAEIKFREQMEFAQKHYKKTNVFLDNFYNKYCLDSNSFVMPYSVFRELFFTEWKDLGILWIQHIKSQRLKK